MEFLAYRVDVVRVT